MAERALWEKFARGTAVILGITAPVACASQPPALVRSIEASPSPVVLVKPTEIVIIPTAVPPTETAVPPIPTSTEVQPSPTTKPTTAPTVELTKEKALLPTYVVFTGRLVDIKTKQAVGTILVSQLPEPVDKVLIFYRAQQISGTGTTGSPFLWTPKPTNIPGLYENAESGYAGVTLNLIKPGLTAGNLRYKDGSREMTFTLEQVGKGDRSILDSIKEIQIREQKLGAATISDQRVLNDLKAQGITLP